jgi:hypothetical protein
MDIDFPIAFIVEDPEQPSLEIRVNFGVFAGREATPAEIDDLARRLLFEVSEIEIVAENRYEVAEGSEAQLHQVRIAVSEPGADSARLVETAEMWARSCIELRHAEVSEL